MVIFSDVSYTDDSPIYVGFVIQKNRRIVFRGAFEVARKDGINPEDVAVLTLRRVFKDATAFYTDYDSTRYGTPVWRNHPSIAECHTLAGAARKGWDFALE